jgi:hypothetical protein
VEYLRGSQYLLNLLVVKVVTVEIGLGKLELEVAVDMLVVAVDNYTDFVAAFVVDMKKVVESLIEGKKRL